MESAIGLLPETLGGLSAVGVGALAGIFQKYRWALWGGWGLTTLGAGLIYLLGPETTVIQWVFLNLPFGIGTGMLFTAQILAVQAATEPELNGQAAAFFSFIRIFGSATGVAVSGVIFQNTFRRKLAGLGEFAHLADEYSRDATIVVEVIKHMEDGATKSELVQAFADALKVLWLSLLAFSAVGLVLSVTVKSFSMTQEHVTKQKLVEKEKSKANNTEAGIIEANQSEMIEK